MNSTAQEQGPEPCRGYAFLITGVVSLLLNAMAAAVMALKNRMTRRHEQRAVEESGGTARSSRELD